MPDGRTHTGINLAVLFGLQAMLTTVTHAVPTSTLPFVAGYLVGTFLITPDLDFGARVRVNARRNWGALEVIWFPLGLLFKHRGMTHTYLRGSTLLLAYALVVLGTLLFIVRLLMNKLDIAVLAIPTPNFSQLFCAWVGYILAYGLHLWLDGYRPWLIKHW